VPLRWAPGPPPSPHLTGSSQNHAPGEDEKRIHRKKGEESKPKRTRRRPTGCGKWWHEENHGKNGSCRSRGKKQQQKSLTSTSTSTIQSSSLSTRVQIFLHLHYSAVRYSTVPASRLRAPLPQPASSARCEDTPRWPDPDARGPSLCLSAPCRRSISMQMQT